MHSVCVHSEERVYFRGRYFLWDISHLFTFLFLIGGFTWTEGRMGDGDVRSFTMTALLHRDMTIIVQIITP
jgi:hypothetical protein